jgi:hypothetical protein
MTSKQFLRISALSFGFLDAGSVLAQEGLGNSWQEKQMAQPQTGRNGEVDLDTFRDRVQMRMRSMNQDERTLMNDLSVNGRQRLEAESAAQSRGMEGRRFGRGYEARQMLQNPAISGGSSMTGAGSGGPGMGASGGGRGGSGRGR